MWVQDRYHLLSSGAVLRRLVGGKKARKTSDLGSHATLFQKGPLQTHVTFLYLEKVIRDYTEESWH